MTASSAQDRYLDSHAEMAAVHVDFPVAPGREPGSLVGLGVPQVGNCGQHVLHLMQEAGDQSRPQQLT